MVTKLRKTLGLPRDVPFDYQLAMDRLRDFRAPRDKLRRLCESGEVIQVKRGLYIAGSDAETQQRVDSRVLSGLVYGPSYMEQTGPWKGDAPLTGEALKSLLQDRFAEVDFEQAKDDVLFFIHDADAVVLWSEEFFVGLLKRLKVG